MRARTGWPIPTPSKAQPVDECIPISPLPPRPASNPLSPHRPPAPLPSPPPSSYPPLPQPPVPAPPPPHAPPLPAVPPQIAAYEQLYMSPPPPQQPPPQPTADAPTPAAPPQPPPPPPSPLDAALRTALALLEGARPGLMLAALLRSALLLVAQLERDLGLDLQKAAGTAGVTLVSGGVGGVRDGGEWCRGIVGVWVAV